MQKHESQFRFGFTKTEPNRTDVKKWKPKVGFPWHFAKTQSTIFCLIKVILRIKCYRQICLRVTTVWLVTSRHCRMASNQWNGQTCPPSTLQHAQSYSSWYEKLTKSWFYPICKIKPSRTAGCYKNGIETDIQKSIPHIPIKILIIWKEHITE